MLSVLETLRTIGIIPTVDIANCETVIPLIESLIKGNVPCLSIDLSKKAGIDSLKCIQESRLDIVLGASNVTVLDVLKTAIEHNVAFIDTPVHNHDVIQYCIDKAIPVFPECFSLSDIDLAVTMNIKTVKAASIEKLGGIETLSRRYPELDFIPVVESRNALPDYVNLDTVLACSCSWLIQKDLMEQGRYAEIADICESTLQTILCFNLAHIGINEQNEIAALATADQFDRIFGFKAKNGNSSIFAGTCIEIMKKPFLGKFGHIAISVTNIERAMAYLERKGICFDYDTIKKNANGTIQAVYIDMEISNFAVHLMAKK
jgi:2-dehydro-3-deoxyphosphogluconate aldolase/(4S)-4-hydroxy-2-oxoglutarate aldolase